MISLEMVGKAIEADFFIILTIVVCVTVWYSTRPPKGPFE